MTDKDVIIKFTDVKRIYKVGSERIHALDGVSVEEKGREIFEHILTVASGTRTKSEELGYGDNEFVPWQIGAVM